MPSPLLLVGQMTQIIALATVLGLAFNAASPLGVRWNPPPPPVSTAPPAGSTPPKVTGSQVKRLMAGGPVVLVDARAALAYRAGHIPGAVSLPPDPKSKLLEPFASQHPPNTPIVIYCASSDCTQSDTLASLLATRFGYTQLLILSGGYAEYLAMEGKP
jgi:rhodanese-related sulfurtransferase